MARRGCQAPAGHCVVGNAWPGCGWLRMLVAVPRHLELRELTADSIPAAGRLLARRHLRHRVAQPLLSRRFEEASAAEAEVRMAFESSDASGAVAIDGDRVVGYLLGAPKQSPVWGPNVWVEAAGQAVERAEDIRDLYAFAATRWVDEGRTAHYGLLPAHDDALLDAWNRLGFGQQHLHA